MDRGCACCGPADCFDRSECSSQTQSLWSNVGISVHVALGGEEFAGRWLDASFSTAALFPHSANKKRKKRNKKRTARKNGINGRKAAQETKRRYNRVGPTLSVRVTTPVRLFRRGVRLLGRLDSSFLFFCLVSSFTTPFELFRCHRLLLLRTKNSAFATMLFVFGKNNIGSIG